MCLMDEVIRLSEKKWIKRKLSLLETQVHSFPFDLGDGSEGECLVELITKYPHAITPQSYCQSNLAVLSNK